MNDTEEVTETPKELTEVEKAIKESSDEIAEIFRQMFNEEILVNGTYPEIKNFQTALFFIVLVHDETKTIDKHLEVVKYFMAMTKGTEKIPAKELTPGLKAIKDLFVKYECRHLALDIEKRFENLKSDIISSNLKVKG